MKASPMKLSSPKECQIVATETRHRKKAKLLGGKSLRRSNESTRAGKKITCLWADGSEVSSIYIEGGNKRGSRVSVFEKPCSA